MRGITIRFGNHTYAAIKAEADREGIGITAYIREAAISRAIIAKARRGEYDHTEAVNRAVRQWLADQDD